MRGKIFLVYSHPLFLIPVLLRITRLNYRQVDQKNQRFRIAFHNRRCLVDVSGIVFMK